MKILRTGKIAFPEIIKAIDNAEESIVINMFIWRNDNIGCALAIALINAANRGVKIKIVKDRYGLICEKCEENKASFFHSSTSVVEAIKIGFMSFTYIGKQVPNRKINEDDKTLYNALVLNPNVTVEIDIRCDHSKYYLIDDKILFIGGVNVEDKEVEFDFFGREYRDYMLLIDDEELIKQFKLVCSFPSISVDTQFGVNIKSSQEDPYFGMRQRYIDLIKESKKELTIIMAYLSPLDDIVEEIIAATNRGVAVRVMTSKSSNFQTDTNQKTLDVLSTKSSGKIEIYHAPFMVHTKLVANENTISFGSCNITKKSFNQLDELNIFIDKSLYPTLFKDFRKCVEKDFKEATKISREDLKYNKTWASFEGLLV